jgi:hypothetical protein
MGQITMNGGKARPSVALTDIEWEKPQTEFVMTPSNPDGICEPFLENVTPLREGQPSVRVHCIWDPTRSPETLHYESGGHLYGRRDPGRVRRGNCCFIVATPHSGSRQ